MEFFHRIELVLYNLRFELKIKKTNDSIVLINIDKETQKKYNFKPIPYSSYVNLIELTKKARIIAIDNPLTYFTDINDIKKLSKTLEKKNNVVLSSFFSENFFENSDKNINYITPIHLFTENTPFGFSNYIPDIDGNVRRINFSYYFTQQERYEKSFSYHIAKLFKKDLEEKNRTYLINYVGKEGTFKKYSFIDVINNKNKYKDDFNDKIVIIGSDFSKYKVPFIFNKYMSKSEIHANNINTILEQNFIYKSGTLFNIFLLLVMLSTGLLIGFYFNKKFGSLIISSLAIGYFLINCILFSIFSIYLNIFTPTLTLVFSFIAVKYYFIDNKNREISNVRNIFKPYLAPQMLEEFIRRKDYVEALKGERRVVTVLFADIANFTSISERLPTDQVVTILNEFLTKMTDIIFRNKGTLDKYTGDGVMAVFGNIGKINSQENAIRAVRSAIEMTIELENLQKKWISEGFMPFQIRIGISTGDAVVGNIGSPQQKDFTVIGDTVNISARLEKLNKEYNTSILINRTTYDYVKNTVNVKNLGSAKLKGRDTMVDIFEVIVPK